MIKADTNNPKYEIRRNGETVCVSSMPYYGYPAKTVRDMMAAGYQYAVDGKAVRKV